MATPYSQADFANRVTALFPQPWLSAPAVYVGGPVSQNGIFGSIVQGIGSGLAYVWAQLAYAKLQTRLKTATDTNLEAASLDFFGTGFFPRAPGESDTAYEARIVNELLVDCTIPGIQRVVNEFLAAFTNANPTSQLIGLDSQGGLDTEGGLDEPIPPTQNAPTQILAEDTLGGLDTYGFLDVVAASGSIPTVIVFDQQSNPTLAAAVTPTPITPPQFGVYFRYPNYANTPKIIPAYSPILSALVNAARATPTVAVFCANYP